MELINAVIVCHFIEGNPNLLYLFFLLHSNYQTSIFFMFSTCLFNLETTFLHILFSVLDWYHHDALCPVPDVLLFSEISSLTIDLNPHSSIFYLGMAYAVPLSVLSSKNVMAYASSMMVMKINALMFWVKWLLMNNLSHILNV